MKYGYPILLNTLNNEMIMQYMKSRHSIIKSVNFYLDHFIIFIFSGKCIVGCSFQVFEPFNPSIALRRTLSEPGTFLGIKSGVKEKVKGQLLPIFGNKIA